MTFQIRPASPTGKFQVGVTSYQIVDTSRTETFLDDPTQKRELPLQIWYPAAPTQDARTLAGKSALPWGSLICPPESMATEGYPQFFKQIVELVQIRAESLNFPKLMGEISSHSYPHAPVLKTAAPYPVVLFSHGNGGFIAQTSYLMEELASHGYVVVSIGHTYNTPVNVFSDGRIVPTNFDHPLYKAMNEEFKNTKKMLDEIRKSDSPSIRRQRITELHMHGDVQALLPAYFTIWKTRCQDMTFTIDELHRLAKDPDWIFAEAVDLNRLAAIGYSLGGEAVSQTCVTEPRIKVGVALDSDLWGYLLGQTVSQPFFCICAESNPLDIDYEHEVHSIVLHGTQHASFGTGAYWWEAQGKTDLIGTLGTARCHEITRHFVLAFLNYYLCNVKDNILDGTTETYPEVSYLSAHLV